LAVFVLDKRRKPLMPCSEKRARLLLTRGRAVVHRSVAEFLTGKPAMLARIKGQARAPRKDAAAVNATRYGYAWRPAFPPPADAGRLHRGGLG
jgi:hypothetical protein